MTERLTEDCLNSVILDAVLLVVKVLIMEPKWVKKLAYEVNLQPPIEMAAQHLILNESKESKKLS